MDDEDEPPLPGVTPELTAELATHLAGPEELLCQLAHAIWQVRGSMSFEADWNGPEIRRVKELADQLDDAFRRLPGHTDGAVEQAFERESQRLFPSQIAELFKYGIVPYLELFRTQLRLLSSALETRRSAGRPSEVDRDWLAAEAARLFRASGVEPTKYGEGIFARVLRVMFRHAGFAVPADMYRIVAKAIDTSQ